jgi:outer membrane protein TolC
MIAMLVVAFLPATAHAENGSSPVKGEPAVTEEVLALGLNETITKALMANLDIAVERYNPDIRAAELMSAQGEFDPIIRVDYSYAETEVPQTTREGLATNAGTTETVVKDLSLTFEGKLSPGTEYQAFFDRQQSQFTQRNVYDPVSMTFTDERNPAEYDLDLNFSFTQPILKDFGFDANLAEIRIARGEKSMSIEDFRTRVMDTISEVQSVYWDLLAAIENLRVTEQSLALAQNLLEENRIRLKVGTMAPLEVLQAETGVAQREEEMIVARALVKDVEDNLKRLLNLPKDTDDWRIRIMPTDRPQVVEKEVYLRDQVELAFRKRPDYKRALMQIENDTINERFARNQVLPSVDVDGQYQFLAVDEEFHQAFDDIERGTSPSWLLGVTAEYPIGNRAAKGEYARAQLERMQSEKESENLRLSIIVEVNKAVRDLQTSLKRIEVTTKTVELAEESLEAEKKKLEVGVSTSYDVLQFEEQLADARRRRILAHLNYVKSLVNLARATGTILEEHNIVIEETL